MPNNVFYGQSATALNPAMQDVMRGHEQSYQSGLQMFGDQMKQEQIRRVAAMGAEQLGQLGPEGEWWAQKLMSDPFAAYQMAESYGGFGAIQQRLAYANAIKNSTNAQERLDAASIHFGPQAGANVLNANASMLNALDDSDEYVVIKSGDGFLYRVNKRTGASERVDGQGQPISSGEGGDAFTFGNALTLAGQNARSGKDFEQQRLFYEQAVSAAQQAASNGGKSPGSADFALVTAYAKMLDPNSTVKQEEGRFVIATTSSDVADVFTRFLRAISPTGVLNPSARYTLLQQIQSLYNTQAVRQNDLLRQMKEQAAIVSPDPRMQALSIPVGMEPSSLKFDLEPWKKMADEFNAKLPGQGEDPNAERQGEWTDETGTYKRAGKFLLKKVGENQWQEVR